VTQPTQPTEPTIRIDRGSPSPDELAAVTAVLLGIAAARGAVAAGPPRRVRATWTSDPGRYLAPTSWAAG
jgi:Acyl-CoA carboxylase epsilon subunit